MSMLRKLPVQRRSGQPADSCDGRKTSTDSCNADGHKTATENCADNRPGRVVIRIGPEKAATQPSHYKKRQAAASLFHVKDIYKKNNTNASGGRGLVNMTIQNFLNVLQQKVGHTFIIPH